jgi:hypothetical protein
MILSKHHPQDDMNQPSLFEEGAKYARFNFLVGYFVAQKTERPTWNKGDFFGEHSGKDKAVIREQFEENFTLVARISNRESISLSKTIPAPLSSFSKRRTFSSQPGQRCFFLSFCATRAFTSFLTSAVGSGLSVGKWMVPLDVERPLSSFLNASITDAVGNKLQWLENAANHTSDPLYLNAGIP